VVNAPSGEGLCLGHVGWSVIAGVYRVMIINVGYGKGRDAWPSR
jgi:hypothetical protein